jgi:hypothetical protein
VAVSVNATGAAQTGAASTTGFTDAASHITVAAGSNRALCLALQLSAKPSSVTANWDTTGTNQAMGLAGAAQGESDNLAFCYLFGLIAPTTGALKLKVTWSVTSASWTYCLIAFNGADQAAVGTTFKNYTSAGTASAANSGGNGAFAYPTGGVNINSPSGDFCILSAGSNNQGFDTVTGGTGQVGTFLYGLNTNVSGGAVYTTGGGASTNLALSANGNGGVSQPCCYAGCDIAAVAASGAIVPRLRLVGVGR